MRRASSKLLSHLHHQPHPKSSLSLLPKELTTQLSSLSTTTTTNEPNYNHPSQGHFKTHNFLKLTQYLANPSQNFSTVVDPQSPPYQLSSRQRKSKEKSDLEEAFESAKTAEDMLYAFKEMEASFDERELGLASLKIGLKLDQEGEDPEKIMSFATRALKIIESEQYGYEKPLSLNEKLSLSMTLQLLGSTCYSLKRFNDALGYLNRADMILSWLTKEDSSSSLADINAVLHAVQLELANTKTALGRREDALGNLRKCLEIKEMTLEEGSVEVGNSNRDVAEAYVAVLNFKEALPYCLKAMEIHKAQLGLNSVEVAHDRRLLGVIYTGLEQHEKALEQNQMSQKVLKNWGLSSDLLRAEIDSANMQIALGKYDEAINTLKGVIPQTDKESEHRAVVFISMAKALGNQEKFVDSKRCLEIASSILGKKELNSPLEVSEAYMEISMQYETMNEFETAISLLKKAQAMLERIPQEHHSVGTVCARIGWLLLLTGKVDQAVPYLEDAAGRLKESYGSTHFGVGYVYNNLGAAYLELDRPQSAAQVFGVAQEIMDRSLGPSHVDTIEAAQNLSKAYSAMGSYALAINFQQNVVHAWENHGPSAQDELKEANRLLEQLEAKARFASADGNPLKGSPSCQTGEVTSTRSSRPRVSSRAKP
ncbi:hypothetical protein RJ640_019604 [Escallonia rubra]|uniref:Kinesin light chain n=1 Tax=Escallonia rubra TaxID=112253 RepID=A0AA88ULD9_9ASTE|nr:hypothetical protein RJ640_019604 [Escallonia rubra]